MIWCNVRCNKYFSFAPRLKTLKKQGKKNLCKYIYICKDIQMFFKKKTLIHSYMKLRCKQDCNAAWI
jgi:hypothetical protein